VILSDDFSSEINGWDTYSDADGAVWYENGWLCMKDYYSSEHAETAYAGLRLTDCIVEVETKLIGGTDENWHSVSCRTDGIENAYSFNIGADGTYYISKFIDSEQIMLCDMGTSIHIQTGLNAVNLMRVECIGTRLTLSVNGHTLVTVTDSALSSGDIALEASCAADSYTEVAFDNIVIYAP